MSKLAIALVAVVAVGGAAYAGTQWYANQKAEEEVAAFAESVSDQADLSYGRVSTSLWQRQAQVEDIRIDLYEPEQSVTIEQLEVLQFDAANDPPTYAQVQISGLQFELTDEPAEVSATLGYTDLSSNLYLDYALAEQVGYWSLSWETETAFELALDIELHNLDLSNPEELDLASAAALAIGPITLDYTDDSLINRIYEYAAAEQGTDVEAIKDTLQESLRLAGSSYPGFEDAIASLSQFIDNPSRLTIVVEPPEPVNVMQLVITDPNQWPDLLNMQVTTR